MKDQRNDGGALLHAQDWPLVVAAVAYHCGLFALAGWLLFR